MNLEVVVLALGLVLGLPVGEIQLLVVRLDLVLLLLGDPACLVLGHLLSLLVGSLCASYPRCPPQDEGRS